MWRMRKQLTLATVPVVAALFLALPVPAQISQEPQATEEPELRSFVPRPDAVFLQKSGVNPALGDTLVILQLNDEEVSRLQKATQRTDLLAIGADGQQVVFRDDGQEGDPVAGDFEFTAISEVDSQEVAERAEADQTSANLGETRSVPVFENRALVGETSTGTFDAAAFEAGERVQLSVGASISSPDGAALIADGDLQSLGAAAVVPGTNQFQDRVLMIRDPLVVHDPLRTFDVCTNTGTPMGVWTFGHLMTEMANQTASGISPSTFVENWLNHWLANQNINNFTVPNRAAAMQALINDWRNASGGGPLDLSIAPFRLLAITPRVDLRTTVGGSGGYGSTGAGAFLDAGEARFTFGVVLPQNYVQSRPLMSIGAGVIPNNCLATLFSVIFEYRVPKCECRDVRAWARAWRRLNNFVPGSATYNGLLERLTRTFTDRNRNPARPNRSAIGQVRSNEIALQIPWEIREFQLRMMPFSFLLETTTADSPDDSFNVRPGFPAPPPDFGNFVIDVFNGVTGPSVPLLYPLGSGNNFLGAHPRTPNPGTTFWSAAIFPTCAAPDQTRHLTSFGTCNGCHARETNTVFQHIVSNAPPPAPISQFLTGTVPPVADPVDGVCGPNPPFPTMREFDDLARREIDINVVAKMICARFRPVVLKAVNILPGPVQAPGTELEALAAAAVAANTKVETDPDGPPLSLAPEDLLREVVQQVH